MEWTRRVACTHVKACKWSAVVWDKDKEVTGYKGNEQSYFDSQTDRQTVSQKTDRQTKTGRKFLRLTNRQTDGKAREKATSVKSNWSESLICIMQNDDFNKIIHLFVQKRGKNMPHPSKRNSGSKVVDIFASR